MASSDRDGSRLEEAVREVLETVHARNPDNTGWLLTVRAPTLGLDFHGALGVAPGTGEPLGPETTFRIASVTKTFTAAATLRLVEEGRLELDAPLAALLPAPYPTLLTRGGYDLAAITVRHLLTHTSGLFDYGESPEYARAAASNPHHRWTREEQVRLAMEHGAPTSAPGARFAYSDTGYVLLGALLEERTGLDLARALRSLDRFEALGLTSTWLEAIEPPPPGAPRCAPQRIDDVPFTQIDASLDLWGGGGLVSTTRDLEAFYRALFEGRVFSRPETLQTMLTVPATNAGARMAMGLAELSVDGLRCWHHEGAWGAAALFCPELGLGLATTRLVAKMRERGLAALQVALVRAVRDGRR